MPRQLREVVFVDGVRTPFGKAGDKGMYAETRADDLVIKCIRELLRRNPQLPPERVDEVAIAATTQIGDQGLTIGRTAALLAGLPQTVPGYAIDRMCAGAMTAVTTTAAGIAFGAYDVAIAGGVEHMGRHPMGEGVDPNPRIVVRAARRPRRAGHGQDRREPARPLPARSPRSAPTRYAVRSPGEDRRGLRRRQDPARPGPGRHPVAPSSAGAWPPTDEPLRPGTTMEDARRAQDAVPPARQGHRRQRRRPQRRRHRLRSSPTRRPPSELGLPVRMRLVVLRLRRRRARGHGRRPDPGDREGAQAGRPDHRRHRRCSSSTRRSPCRCWRSSTTSASPTTTRGSTRTAAPSPIGHPLASSGVRLMTQLARQFEEHPEVRYGLTTMCIGIGMGGTVIWENPHCDTERTPDERPDHTC